jgi:hypothetical protein
VSKDKYAGKKNNSQPSNAANPSEIKQQVPQPPQAAIRPEIKQQVSPPSQVTIPPERRQQIPQSQSDKTTVSPSVSPVKTLRVQPEGMSLTAHSQIKQYLTTAAKIDMDKEDLNAVLRLSQHLRLFGLLSAVGYVNQSNAQGGKVRDRTVPVWSSLLGQMLAKPTDAKDPIQRRELMETVVEMARNQPSQYMANWRKSMMLSEQWNFWARAYSKGE